MQGIRHIKRRDVNILDRGRDTDCSAPSAQIPASGTTAPGSYLGCLAKKRTLGCGCNILGLGIQRPTSLPKRFHVIREHWLRRRKRLQQCGLELHPEAHAPLPFRRTGPNTAFRHWCCTSTALGATWTTCWLWQLIDFASTWGIRPSGPSTDKRAPYLISINHLYTILYRQGTRIKSPMLHFSTRNSPNMELRL
jgi:hypothetical protein